MKYDFKIKKLPKSEVEIECTIESSELDGARKKAIKKLGETISVDGFRKGNIPENIVVSKLGESTILSEAAEIAINEHYGKILIEANIDAIGRPDVSITKIAFGNPLEFKIKVATLPEFKLPDYKKIGTDLANKNNKEEPEVTEKEVEDVLFEIRKNKAHHDWHNQNKDKGHDDPSHPNFEEEANLPTLDDELAKAAGNFANLEELRTKVRENIKNEKKNKEADKQRATLMEELIKNTEIELPEILVVSEVEKSLAQMKDDIARMKGKWEEYLSHINKDESKLREELREQGEKKAKIQLIFNAIAKAENLKPDQTILENEVKNILEHYREANEENVRIYVESMLINQEVLRLLEQQ